MPENEPKPVVRDRHGHLMVERPNRQTGGKFYGCSLYPECTETLDLKGIPATYWMRRSGAQGLPGFE